MKKNPLHDKIVRLEGELSSFEKDKLEVDGLLYHNKIKLIKEVKMGLFDEDLSEIERRKEIKKKESIFDKIFKLF